MTQALDVSAMAAYRRGVAVAGATGIRPLQRGFRRVWRPGPRPYLTALTRPWRHLGTRPGDRPASAVEVVAASAMPTIDGSIGNQQRHNLGSGNFGSFNIVGQLGGNNIGARRSSGRQQLSDLQTWANLNTGFANAGIGSFRNCEHRQQQYRQRPDLEIANRWRTQFRLGNVGLFNAGSANISFSSQLGNGSFGIGNSGSFSTVFNPGHGNAGFLNAGSFNTGHVRRWNTGSSTASATTTGAFNPGPSNTVPSTRAAPTPKLVQHRKHQLTSAFNIGDGQTVIGT